MLKILDFPSHLFSAFTSFFSHHDDEIIFQNKIINLKYNYTSITISVKSNSFHDFNIYFKKGESLCVESD